MEDGLSADSILGSTTDLATNLISATSACKSSKGPAKL